MRYGLVAALLVCAGSARAHVGAVVANAVFTSPAPPIVDATDAGSALEPYSFAQADGSFTVSWKDGDNDPTGHFSFYYLDHAPSFEVLSSDIPSLGHPMAEAVDGGASNAPVAIYAGCSCNPDAGVG